MSENTETPARTTTPNFLRVLKALHAGHPVQVAGRTLRMTENNDIVIEATAYCIDENDQQVNLPARYLPLHMTVGEFARHCNEEITELENINLTNQLAMVHIKRARI